ncbi:hypothetical protein BB561_002175 [Smittium simulii]|uniref:Reverse transcriptase domain-containing protein n=1 Tax=Smittium simulii TaxID=133385 RepID=A0A2T9YRJ9_9FUNG|nr:hypothetical protein BB561_002175 [Smittium simulii]
MYINDIFNGMAGVSVPGLDEKISGLFFADDVVILVESIDKLQKSFDILTEWCKRWDMNVNNKKYGIMAKNCSTDTTSKNIKAFKIYIGCYSILKSNDIPTRFKALVIKAIIEAVRTYGGEFFGLLTRIGNQKLEKCNKPAAMIQSRQKLNSNYLDKKTDITRTWEFSK